MACCQYCGKVLTTGDRIDRCFPDCQERLIEPMVINILDVQQERDKLRDENDVLREALKWISNYKEESKYPQFWINDIRIMRLKAQQALNEVTNSKTDYKEHLTNMPESEYKRLHEGRWENEENEVTK